MRFSIISIWALAVIILASCDSGVSKLDFVNKKFLVTYNVDSTRGFDSLQLSTLRISRAIYNFSDGGKGTTHIQTGMLSKDTPFTWKVQNDTIVIDQASYRVKKEDQALILRSDSVKMFLSEQQ